MIHFTSKVVLLFAMKNICSWDTSWFHPQVATSLSETSPIDMQVRNFMLSFSVCIGGWSLFTSRALEKVVLVSNIISAFETVFMY